MAIETLSPQPTRLSEAQNLSKELEDHGIVRLPTLVDARSLREMQEAFGARMHRMRWNDFDGYERTERLRLMVQDILTLSQGFMDVAVHPLVNEVLRGYLGDSYELVEAKGWQSQRTKRDFHGWHGDCWYDQKTITDRIPREIKLGFYLTDVTSGALQYIRGSHGQTTPRQFKKYEIKDLPMERMAEMNGPAGTAFLFDTSGIHRQGIPILEPRRAFFLNYHDPSIPLQQEDIDYYRYHPLLLNAAFLGGLDHEATRILGFGNKTNYVPAFRRKSRHRGLQSVMNGMYGFKLTASETWIRLKSRVCKLCGK